MFSPNSKNSYDIDPSSISKNIRVDVSGDVKKVLSLLIKSIKENKLEHPNIELWWKEIETWRKKFIFIQARRQNY